jgi:hypothetical protein
MKPFLIVVYLLGFFAFALWFDAMERTYKSQSSPWLLTTILAAGWPIALPTIMASITTKEHRWVEGISK